jgi:hypothetical protein
MGFQKMRKKGKTKITQFKSPASFLEKIGDFWKEVLPPVFLLTRGKRGEVFLNEREGKWKRGNFC